MAHNVFEFCTDPSTMAEMTMDHSPTPEELCILAEEEGVDISLYLNEGNLNMSNKTPTTPKTAKLDVPAPAKLDVPAERELPFLNTMPEANVLGLLFVTKDLHAHLQNEAERLRRAQVSNLWWIAAFAGEYGEQPTIEDVFHTAPAIAEDVDAFIYDRQALPNGYQDDRGRIGRTTNQYRSIEDNAGRLLENQVVINTLKAAGYTADHLTARELYSALAEQGRKRDVERKAREDNAARVQRMKLQEAAKASAKRYDLEI
jgi:hypothetical protein